MNIRLITTALSLLVICAFGFTSAYADEQFSLESLECYISDGIITLTVPMPKGLDNANREALSKYVCDSIDERDMIPSPAVCDTDMNCEYYDYYHEFGVASIKFHHDVGNVRWIAVSCVGDTKDDWPMIIDDPTEMEVICK